MCGLAGAVAVDGAAPAFDERPVIAALEHRGPDSSASWTSTDGAARLVHCRLAIRDLSPAGAQPMTSSCGRLTVAYNGELYALDGLRARLGARRLRSTSDTEVLVEACAEWGPDRVLPELVGMFAFALWESDERRLTLVRDRLGIKPLYWSLDDGVLAFASELRALRRIDPRPRALDRDALVTYFRLNHFAEDRTVHEGVRRLRPGGRLRLHRGELTVDRWWDAATTLAAVGRGPAVADAELLDRLDAAVVTAVRDRLVADVPLGALLSGGIDSTLVTAVMMEEASRPVRTFTVAIDGDGYDESAHARAIAEHLGTDHTEVRLSSAEALELVPSLPAMFGEPFADSSAIPTSLVFAHARPHVTVTMTGDGADEVFAGYPRYRRALALDRAVGRAPRALGPVLARAAAAASSLLAISGRLTGPGRAGPASRQLHKAAGAIAARDAGDAYRVILSQWRDPARLVPGATEPLTAFDDPTIRERFPDPLERLQVLDLLVTLPDDMLTKVDRASMWSSVEARVPLLDHRLLEVAWMLPRHLRIEGDRGKVALRHLLARRVPPALWERPKSGFAVPLDAWLRGPLRAWAEDLLAPEALARSGVVDVGLVRRTWQRHLTAADESAALWGVLCLQAWLDAER
jgi:asparagine synthase (glutamine-hydrolysing)